MTAGTRWRTASGQEAEAGASSQNTARGTRSEESQDRVLLSGSLEAVELFRDERFVPLASHLLDIRRFPVCRGLSLGLLGGVQIRLRPCRLIIVLRRDGHGPNARAD